MPNHFHCIIEILDNDGMDDNPIADDNRIADAHVGASLRGRPIPEHQSIPKHQPIPEHQSIPVTRPKNNNENAGNIPIDNNKSPYGPDNKKSNTSIFDMMDWFKTMTTNEYIRGVKTKNWPRYKKHLWQPRYWDHIIRNENEYHRIANYIKNNPAKWKDDIFNN